MRIHKIKITNFKSFIGTDLKINAGFLPNVFIGKNESGKSNLLKALDLKTLVFQKNQEDYFMQNFDNHLLKSDLENSINVEIEDLKNKPDLYRAAQFYPRCVQFWIDEWNRWETSSLFKTGQQNIQLFIDLNRESVFLFKELFKHFEFENYVNCPFFEFLSKIQSEDKIDSFLILNLERKHWTKKWVWNFEFEFNRLNSKLKPSLNYKLKDVEQSVVKELSKNIWIHLKSKSFSAKYYSAFQNLLDDLATNPFLDWKDIKESIFKIESLLFPFSGDNNKVNKIPESLENDKKLFLRNRANDLQNQINAVRRQFQPRETPIDIEHLLKPWLIESHWNFADYKKINALTSSIYLSMSLLLVFQSLKAKIWEKSQFINYKKDYFDFFAKYQSLAWLCWKCSEIDNVNFLEKYKKCKSEHYYFSKRIDSENPRIISREFSPSKNEVKFHVANRQNQELIGRTKRQTSSYSFSNSPKNIWPVSIHISSQDEVKEILNLFMGDLSVEDKKFIQENLINKKDFQHLTADSRNKIEKLLTTSILFDEKTILSVELERDCLLITVKENWQNESDNFSSIDQRSDGFKSCLFFNYIKSKFTNSYLKDENNWESWIWEFPILENERTNIQSLINQLIDKLSFNVLLVDEPESHLHPDAQEKLFHDLNTFSRKNKINTFIFTHSPHFICPNKFENTKVLIRRLKGDSEKYTTDIFSNLNDFQKTQNHKNQPYTRAIEIALGYRLKLAFLDEKRKYVVVEGIRDYWLLKAIFEAKNCENFYFYNINSNTEDLMIEFCKMLHLNFVVIFDNDGGGREKIQNFVKKHDPWIKVENKHSSFITWELIDENKSDIESFISEKDKAKFCSESWKKGGNKKMKIDDQILEKTVSTKNWFNQEIDQETRDNFNKIYDWIHKLLKK